MSEENVEIVRKCYEAFNAFMRRELSEEAISEVARQFVDPEVEWRWHGRRTMPDQPQQLRGFPEFVAFWEQFRSAWVDLVTEPLEFIEAPGDCVLVVLRQSGRGRESGVPIETHFFQVWWIRDGKVRKGEIFRHRADALEAAGVRE